VSTSLANLVKVTGAPGRKESNFLSYPLPGVIVGGGGSI